MTEKMTKVEKTEKAEKTEKTEQVKADMAYSSNSAPTPKKKKVPDTVTCGDCDTKYPAGTTVCPRDGNTL